MKYERNVAVQAYNSKNEDLCLTCGEITSHPLCQDCIGNSFFTWLHEHKKIEPETKEVVQHFLEKTKHTKGKRCIGCGKEKVHTCPYCFTEYLYKVIKEAGAGVTILTNFLFVFNFDFDGKGYAQEYHAYGGF